VVGADGWIVTAVAPPWALDANAQSVPTGYRIEGTTLVQVIDHHGAAYPVVGDPNWDVFWNRVAIYFNRAEIKTIKDSGWSTPVVSGICLAAGRSCLSLWGRYGCAMRCSNGNDRVPGQCGPYLRRVSSAVQVPWPLRCPGEEAQWRYL
jgi:hypothetical protein